MTTKPIRLFAIEQAIHHWVWKDAPANLTIEALLTDSIWAHVVQQLMPGAHVTVQPEGLPWEAELIVLGVGTGFAKVKLLHQHMLNEPGELPAGIVVKWNGPTHKYVVQREGDSEILKFGFAMTADAEEWARKHVRAMAA